METWLLVGMQRWYPNTRPEGFSERYICCRRQRLAFALRVGRRNSKRSRGMIMVPMARIISGMLTTRLIRPHGWRWRRKKSLLSSPSLLGPSSRQTMGRPRGWSWWGWKYHAMRRITGWRPWWWWRQRHHVILLLWLRDCWRRWARYVRRTRIHGLRSRSVSLPLLVS